MREIGQEYRNRVWVGWDKIKEIILFLTSTIVLSTSSIPSLSIPSNFS